MSARRWERVGLDVRTARTADDGGFLVATVDESPLHDERHANARLIAAAPELLSALRELLALGQQESIEDGDLEAAQAAAKAAIRKAVTP